MNRWLQSIAIVTLAVTTAWAENPPPPQEAFDAAEKLYQTGKTDAALAAFQRFEKDYPLSSLLPGVIYYQGWCAFQLRRFEDATETFGRLLRDYPAAALVPETLLKQAECWRQLKQPDKAAEQYRVFQSRYPNHPLGATALFGLAGALFDQKKFADAKTVLSQYRTAYREDWENGFDGPSLLAQILTEEKNFTEAQAIYQQLAARSNNPRAAEGLYLAAQSLFDAKRYADAIPLFQRVPATATLLAGVDQQLADAQNNRTGLIAQLGVAGYQARVESLQKLAAQIKERPDLLPPALLRIANCYQFLHQPDNAIAAYRDLLAKFPAHKVAEAAQFGLIQTLIERDRLAEANAETERFKTKYPQSLLLTSASLLQAESLYTTGQHDRALALYLKARDNLTDPAARETVDFRIASCRFALNQFDQARDAYAAFLQNYPQSKVIPDALFRLARAHLELAGKTADPKTAESDLRAAIKYMEQLRADYPRPELLPDVMFQLGYLYSQLATHEPANYDKALLMLTEFRRQWPDHALAPAALYEIARLKAATRKYDDAIAAYRDLLAKYPTDKLAPHAAYEIGVTYYNAGNRAEMIGAFRACATQFPTYPKIGDALLAIGAQFEDDGRQLLASEQTADAAAKFTDAIAAYRDLVRRATVAPAGMDTDSLRRAAISAQVKLAGLLEQRGAVKEALAECEQFLATFGQNPAAARAMLAEIATLYRNAKQAVAGCAALDRLRAQYPQNAAIRIAALGGVVDLALSAGDYVRANGAAAQLMLDAEVDRLPALTYAGIGETFLKTGQFDRARTAFSKMRAAFGDDPKMTIQAQLGLAQAAFGQKKLDEAEAAFTELAKLAPEAGVRGDAELGLARIAKARGRTAESVDRYNNVLSLARGEASDEAAFELGNYFFQMPGIDNQRAALAYFARLFFATGPMAEESAFRVGQCHEAIGNPAAARGAYQTYLRRFGDGKFAGQAQERIKALTKP